MIASSGQGLAPDKVSFAKPARFSILQHIGASIPSKVECEKHEGQRQKNRVRRPAVSRRKRLLGALSYALVRMPEQNGRRKRHQSPVMILIA